MSTPTMRRLRHNNVEMAPLNIERETFAHDDGRLTQEMGLYADGKILMSTEWTLALLGSRDEPLRGLDHHWKNLKREFRETMEQAAEYQRVKQDPGENTRDNYMRLVARRVSSDLFQQPMADEYFATTNYRDENIGPEYSLSERFTILRKFIAGEKNTSTAKLDKFEKIIEVIGKRLDRATSDYYRATRHSRGGDGYQSTAGDSDDDDKSWRGDGHPTETGDHHKNPWQHEQTSSHSGDEHHEHEYDDQPHYKKMDAVFQQYSQSLRSFRDAANSLWLMAAKQVENQQEVAVFAPSLEEMKNMLKEEEKLYGELKEIAEDSDVKHQLPAVFDRLDGDKKNMHEIMQMAISMASSSSLHQ